MRLQGLRNALPLHLRCPPRFTALEWKTGSPTAGLKPHLSAARFFKPVPQGIAVATTPMARVRLCLAVECTAKAGSVWPTALRHVVEPLLALAEASSGGAGAQGLQLALVLFGALPPHSAAVVESVLGWCASVQQFRRLLDSLNFVGGGGRQPVMLAHALAEAAALFAAADAGGSGGPCQQHCLVCLASEPAVQPVSWPFAEDCCMVGACGRWGTSCSSCWQASQACLLADPSVGCLPTAFTHLPALHTS